MSNPPDSPEPARESSSLYLTVDGRRIEARPEQSVATAMLAADLPLHTRSVKYHRPRGAFCLAGQCGQCLVRIDGRPSLRACMTGAVAGQVIERQNAFPSVDLDVLAAADLVFPRGMDHHTLGAWSGPTAGIVAKVVRQMAGLGKLPEAGLARRPEELPAPETLHVDVVIVGGGPAGLAAAGVLARSALSVLLLDERRQLGGSLLAEARGADLVGRLIAELGNVRVLREATAIGFYAEDSAEPELPPGLLAVATSDGLKKVVAERYLYAPGSYEQNLLFGNNDRPGIVAARGLLRAVHHEGLRLRGKLVVVGDYSHGAASALQAAGHRVERLPPDAQLVAAHGQRRVDRVEWRRGSETHISDADWLVIASRPAPATELLRQHGCVVGWDDTRGGLFVVTDEDGHTDRKHVYACGDVAGVQTAELSMVAGRRAALAIRASLP